MNLTFIKPLMMRLKEARFRVFLETNGVLWQALRDVVEWCDCIAMDMKLASVTGERSFKIEHEQFLRVAKSRDVFIKMVISRGVDVEEFEDLVRIVAEVDATRPVILMPVSSQCEGHEDPGLMQILESMQRIGSRFVPDIRIIPRLHKILKIP